MIVLSAGMQKSGSALFYNIINDLLVEYGCKDVRHVKNNGGLERLMSGRNNNVGKLTLLKVSNLVRLSKKEGTFVVKSHRAPTLIARFLVWMGYLKIIYCYRDPRDVLLSGMDHGKRILSEGKKHSFAKMAEFDQALYYVQRWLKNWQKFAHMDRALMVKYEQILVEPLETISHIEQYLNIGKTTIEKKNEIFWKFSRDNPNIAQRGLHLNKAKSERWRDEMTTEQQKKCLNLFGKTLKEMGYALL